MVLDPSLLDYLFALDRRGIRVGLHRTEALLAKCGNPHILFPSILVAGTNGKGSTCAMIASILRAAGKKTALYTSPHLLRFNERIRVNGVPIPDEPVAAFLREQRSHIDLLGSTFFETTTALAFRHFADESVDVAIVEVGMGGRLDSTNVLSPAVSVITPIGADHMEYLGHTVAEIAREKCGILRKGVPAIIGEQSDEVQQVIAMEAAAHQTQWRSATEAFPAEMKSHTPDGLLFRSSGTEYRLHFCGLHQLDNAQAAAAAVLTYDPMVSAEDMAAGFRATRWPGRLQRLRDNPIVYFDVAHNAHGLAPVIDSLIALHPGRPLRAICALSKRKDADAIADILSGRVASAITTTVSAREELASPQGLAAAFASRRVETRPAADLAAALSEPFQDRTGSVWLIFGTHFLAEPVFWRFEFSFDSGVI